MPKIEVPQADRLERVRDIVEAVSRGATSNEVLSAQTGLEPRHVQYHLNAARILGWIERTDGIPAVTFAAQALLSTKPGTAEEKAVIADSIRASPYLTGFVSALVGTNQPTLKELARLIAERTQLSEATATRRAQSLIRWREYLRPGLGLFETHEVRGLPVARERQPKLRPENREPHMRSSLDRVALTNFKSFERAALELGHFTVVVGANATGKSNLRDAFRLLHGISRGYTVAEVLGEKWVEGGVLQWKGIRGGTAEAAFGGGAGFGLNVEFTVTPSQEQKRPHRGTYRIDFDLARADRVPRVSYERLEIEGRGQYVFESRGFADDDGRHLEVKLRKSKGYVGKTLEFPSDRPVLTQIADHPVAKRDAAVREHSRWAVTAFESMRFLDLSPDAMRNPSLPGQTVLGDRGENLSSVVQAICTDSLRKGILVDWLRELTPLDVVDFDFVPDAAGKILLFLVEENGRKTSANSASDGTLRFLAMIAALVGKEAARFYFFEELENGIHPTRLHLLLQLIEERTSSGEVQVVATSHSPQLLAELSTDAREQAVMAYRPPGAAAAKLRRIVDIPSAREVLATEDVAQLHASGWLENAALFAEPEDA